MIKLLLGLIAGSISFAPLLPIFADQVRTTTETVQGPAQVIDSYMKPTLVQTRHFTTDDGITQTTTTPMILERHEQIIMPSSEVKTTTTVTDPKVITVETTKRVSHVVYHHRRVVTHRVAHKPRHHAVAYRHAAAKKAIAYNVRKTTIVEPQIIQQTQTVREKSVIMERKDPALED